MYLVLYGKQFSHANPSQLSAQMSTLHVACKNWAVAHVERKMKFMEFFGALLLISSVFNYIYVSFAQILYSRWKMQTGVAFF